MISHKDLRFVLTVAESLNPLSYSHLKHRFVLDSVLYLLSLVFVCLFVVAVAQLPHIFSLKGTIVSELEKFESVSVDYEISQSSPVEVSVLGVNALQVGGNKTRFMMSVNSDGVSSGSVLCYSFSPLCPVFAGSFLPSEGLVLSDRREALAGFLLKLFLLSLPGFFLLSFIMHSVKYFLLALALTFLGSFISKLLRFELNLYSSFSVSCYSLTGLVIPQMLLEGIGVGLFGVEWLIFSALFASGLLISGKRIEGDKHGSGRGPENKQLGKGAA